MIFIKIYIKVILLYKCSLFFFPTEQWNISQLLRSVGRRWVSRYTCVSAFIEILLSLQCKIFQYTFLEQYPMKFQDFFFLCQIEWPAWLKHDHRKLGPSKMRLLSEPCIIKLKMKKKFDFMYDMLLWKTFYRVSAEYCMYQDCF